MVYYYHYRWNNRPLTRDFKVPMVPGCWPIIIFRDPESVMFVVNKSQMPPVPWPEKPHPKPGTYDQASQAHDQIELQKESQPFHPVS